MAYAPWDAIAAGEKKREYRDDSPFWRSRLLAHSGLRRVYDNIEFYRGNQLTSTLPRIIASWVGSGQVEADVVDGPYSNGFSVEIGRGSFYVDIGPILTVLNWP